MRNKFPASFRPPILLSYTSITEMISSIWILDTWDPLGRHAVAAKDLLPRVDAVLMKS